MNALNWFDLKFTVFRISNLKSYAESEHDLKFLCTQSLILIYKFVQLFIILCHIYYSMIMIDPTKKNSQHRFDITIILFEQNLVH